MRRDVLLLQGPIGPFFSRFAGDLESRGFRVWKINLNGGDRLFYRRERCVDYTGELKDWYSYLDRFLINREIGRIYLFGDCRAYHRIAREVAAARGVRLFVFEEGYIRPNFITLEEEGVNGHSPMLRDPVSIDRVSDTLPEEASLSRSTFLITAAYSMIYYWACAAYSRRFAAYRHHRPLGWWMEGLRWIRSGTRKWFHAFRERRSMNRLITEFERNYFVCPLQVHCDMQVVVHSHYNSIEHFIGDVLASFVEHAPANKAIVFKHHPLDRGYTDYTALLANLTCELGLQGRVFYVHDVDLPRLLAGAQGTVLINSTVGISALFHGTPVKTLGTAVYDRAGLTEQMSLDEFWSILHRVDGKAFNCFRNNLIVRNQLNGSLYRRLSTSTESGIQWSTELQDAHTWHASRPDSSQAPRLTVIEGRRSLGRAARGGNSKAA